MARDIANEINPVNSAGISDGMTAKDISAVLTYDLNDAAEGESIHLESILPDATLSIPFTDRLMKGRCIRFGFVGLRNRTSFHFSFEEVSRAVIRIICSDPDLPRDRKKTKIWLDVTL